MRDQESSRGDRRDGGDDVKDAPEPRLWLGVGGSCIRQRGLDHDKSMPPSPQVVDVRVASRR